MFSIFPNFPVIDTNAAIYLGVEGMFLFGLGLYVLFALVAASQINNMRKTVITPLSPLIELLGFLHLLMAIGAFVFTLLYLRVA